MANNDDKPGLSLDELEADEDTGSVVEVPEEAAQFDPVEAGEKLAKDTVVLELHVRKPGFLKTLKAGAFVKQDEPKEEGEAPAEDAGRDGKPKANPDFLHVSQDVLDRKEVGKIVSFDDKFTTWLKSRSIPSHMLANGLYMIPLAFTTEVDVALTKFVKERLVLIDELEEKYSALKADAKKNRGEFYVEADYPPFATIRAKYRVEARYLSFNVPAALERINRELYKREAEKVRLQWIDAAQEAVDAQRFAFKEITASFANMLGKNDEGKRKAFQPSTLAKLQEFIKMFADLNITGDAQLESVVAQAKQIMEGVDPAELKKDMSMRDVLKDSFDKIAEAASSLIVVKGRKFTIDDEDAAPAAEVA